MSGTPRIAEAISKEVPGQPVFLPEHLGADRTGDMARDVPSREQIDHRGAEVAPHHLLGKHGAATEVGSHAERPYIVGVVIPLRVMELSVHIHLVVAAAFGTKQDRGRVPQVGIALDEVVEVADQLVGGGDVAAVLLVVGVVVPEAGVGVGVVEGQHLDRDELRAEIPEQMLRDLETLTVAEGNLAVHQ